ncbi:MAG: lipid A biosynthesis acyltransferase [Pseudomonadota bacterium]|nr:MAG: lipid A biosynthesis acyltransferase [Pseudomonadota bacterium]
MSVPWPKRIRRFLRAYAVLALFWLLGRIPFSLALRLGKWGGRLAFHLFGRERRLALSHLALAFPEWSETERRAVARRMFESLGISAMELAQLRKLDPVLEDYVRLPKEAEDLLHRIRRGCGVVMVTGHLGNWELLFRRCLRAGFDAYAVGKESHDPRFTALMERIRGADRVIWRGAPGAARQMLQVFRKDGYLSLLIDQDTKVQGLFVPFFGRLAHTPRAAADLALRAGASVAAIFIRRLPEGGHEISVEEIPPPRSADPETAAWELTAEMTKRIEAAIRRSPHEWVWMHERWKTRPPAENEAGNSPVSAVA